MLAGVSYIRVCGWVLRMHVHACVCEEAQVYKSYHHIQP